MKRFFGLLLALTLLLSLCACASTPAADDTKEPAPAEDTTRRSRTRPLMTKPMTPPATQLPTTSTKASSCP